MKELTPQKANFLILSAAIALLVNACSSLPPPVEQMAVSKATLESASRAGSNEVAPALLKSAMDKMDAADRAMLQEDYLNARQWAEQAQVDAQLAAATARSTKAQKAASALQEGNNILRQEIDRSAQ